MNANPNNIPKILTGDVITIDVLEKKLFVLDSLFWVDWEDEGEDEDDEELLLVLVPELKLEVVLDDVVAVVVVVVVVEDD